jgi:hypothetical protein
VKLVQVNNPAEPRPKGGKDKLNLLCCASGYVFYTFALTVDISPGLEFWDAPGFETRVFSTLRQFCFALLRRLQTSQLSLWLLYCSFAAFFYGGFNRHYGS